MRLLVCEFITGGGMADRPLPKTLAREGDAMLQQLIADLLDCDDIDSIEVLLDPRLPALGHDRVETTFCHRDFFRQLALSIPSVDCVLPIAPETGNVLLEVSELVVKQGKVLLGSRPAAVRLATSKQQTCAVLAQRGIAAVSSFTMAPAPGQRQGEWVIKPDNGAGGEGCRLINGSPVDSMTGLIMQPLIPGTSASLTLLCHQGHADIHACNVQHVALDHEGCHLQGLDVNGLAGEIPVLQSLADAIATAIPDLWGWVGVDFILTDEGPVVLEINPRLTTAYVGLRDSLQQNPAAMLLQLHSSNALPRIPCEHRAVEVRL